MAGAGREDDEVVSIDVSRQSWRSFMLRCLLSGGGGDHIIAGWRLLSLILHTSYSSNPDILTDRHSLSSWPGSHQQRQHHNCFLYFQPSQRYHPTGQPCQQREILDVNNTGSGGGILGLRLADGSLVLSCPR